MKKELLVEIDINPEQIPETIIAKNHQMLGGDFLASLKATNHILLGIEPSIDKSNKSKIISVGVLNFSRAALKSNTQIDNRLISGNDLLVSEDKNGYIKEILGELNNKLRINATARIPRENPNGEVLILSQDQGELAAYFLTKGLINRKDISGGGFSHEETFQIEGLSEQFKEQGIKPFDFVKSGKEKI